MNDDLISRQAARRIIEDINTFVSGWWYSALEQIDELPTADLSEYSDKLWKTAYERGKAEAHPKKGKWINHRNDEGHNIADCDQCGEAMQWFDDIKPNYCPNCGARMEE